MNNVELSKERLELIDKLYFAKLAIANTSVPGHPEFTNTGIRWIALDIPRQYGKTVWAAWTLCSEPRTLVVTSGLQGQDAVLRWIEPIYEQGLAKRPVNATAVALGQSGFMAADILRLAIEYSTATESRLGMLSATRVVTLRDLALYTTEKLREAFPDIGLVILDNCNLDAILRDTIAKILDGAGVCVSLPDVPGARL